MRVLEEALLVSSPHRGDGTRETSQEMLTQPASLERPCPAHKHLCCCWPSRPLSFLAAWLHQDVRPTSRYIGGGASMSCGETASDMIPEDLPVAAKCEQLQQPIFSRGRCSPPSLTLSPRLFLFCMPGFVIAADFMLTDSWTHVQSDGYSSRVTV